MSEERISSALANALERLYQCFAPYQLGAHVEGCPCCVSPDEARALARVPLRDVTGQELLSFSFSALTTWGTESDLKHFLPRILELLTLDQLGTDAQIVFGKLPYTQWHLWPEAERKAIEVFAQAWFRAALVQPPHQLLGILESVGFAGLSVQPLLDHWIESVNSNAATELAKFTWSQAGSLNDGQVRFIWWKAGAHEVGHWLLSGGPAQFLELMVERELSHSQAGLWAQAFDVLSLLAQGPSATDEG
jgi:hypothetical protein